MIEAIVKDQWHDCKIVKVIPPTEEEIKADLEEDEVEKHKEAGVNGAADASTAPPDSSSNSPSKKKKEKEKKAFSPPDHLFKYQVMKIEPEEHEANDVSLIKSQNPRDSNAISIFYFLSFPFTDSGLHRDD